MDWTAAVTARLQALPARRWVVGYSGGLDSSVLLWLCWQAAQHRNPRPELLAVHVNHQLSAHADSWQQHCANQCAEWGLKLQTCRVQVEVGAQGLEQAARQARYAAFAQICQAGDALLLAHHQDDQAETFLLRALRGSGPAGLAAIHAERDWQLPNQTTRIPVLRPLLKVPRAALQALATQVGIAWVDDDSNQRSDVDRNFLRHQVLPVLAQRWPHAAAALARSTHLITVEHQVLMRLIGRACDRAIDSQRNLELTHWQHLPEDEQHLWLRHWLASFALELPSLAVLEQIRAQATTARDDAQVCVHWGERRIYRYQQRLWCIAALAPLDPLWRLPAQPGSPQALGAGIGQIVWQTDPVAGQCGLRADRIDQPLHWRLRLGGERFRPAGRAERTLKKWLQDSQLPPWLRTRLPLLYQGDDLVLVPGLGCSAALAAAPGQPAWWVVWQPPGTS